MDRRLLPLALGAFAGAMEGFGIGGLLPRFADTFGLTIGLTATVVLWYSLTYAIGAPVLTAWLGHVDRRAVIAAAEVLFASCAILIAISPNFTWLLVARLAMALGACLFTALAYATAVALAPTEKRGRAIATVAMGQSLALLFGVPLGVLIAGTFGWRWVYAIIAVLALAAAAIIWFRLPQGIRGERQTLHQRIQVITLPGVPVGLLTTAVYMAAGFLVSVFVAPLAVGLAGLELGALPALLLANGLGAVAGSNAGGRMADRFGPRRTATGICATLALCPLALWALPIFPDWVRVPGFFALLALNSFLGWASWPALSSLLAGLAGGAAPLVLSLNLTALNLGVATTAILGGITLDHFGARGIALLGMGLALCATLLSTGWIGGSSGARPFRPTALAKGT